MANEPDEAGRSTQAEVPTSLGKLHVGVLTFEVLSNIQASFPQEPGRSVAAIYGSEAIRFATRQSLTDPGGVPLSRALLEQLSPVDVTALARAIADINGADPLPLDGDVYEALGKSLQAKLRERLLCLV